MWRRLLQLSTIIILYLILQDGSIVRATEMDERESAIWKALHERDKNRPPKKRHTLSDIEDMDW
jgi:hypothetical protein